MNLKPLWTFMAVFFIVGAACLFWALREDPTGAPDPVAYNDITRTVGERWNTFKAQELPGKEYHLDYVVTDLDGNVLVATRSGLDTTVSTAVRHHDIILDVCANGKVVGNIFFTNSAPYELQAQRRILQIVGLFLIFLPLLFCAGFVLYLRRKLIRPFRRMDAFARSVAAGNLDVPLEMDRQNLFGPFTESFDLMRTELLRAKENEYRAAQSKKELVASLSHDIKTPVASIQAITELMLVREQDSTVRKNLETIHAKARQIAELVENLFHASLEELEKLRVFPTAESSEILPDLLGTADYDGRAIIPAAPPCMLCIDRLRLTQVFDNIFSNSYKYAGTAIRVEFSFDGDFLVTTVSDLGSGVPEESLMLLCNKFYRGENAVGKKGSGLGLYLAHYFMEQMGGRIYCENQVDDGAAHGFIVRVSIPLAGRNFEGSATDHKNIQI